MFIILITLIICILYIYISYTIDINNIHIYIYIYNMSNIITHIFIFKVIQDIVYLHASFSHYERSPSFCRLWNPTRG